jgi:hypothetical protein
MSTSIWCYVWDFLDGRLDRALAEIQDAGLDGISVATAYHSVEHFRLRGERPCVFREPEASLYFKPQRSLYKTTKLKPRVSPLAHKSNPLAKIAAACQKRGLAINSWTVGTHNSHLCRQRPDCATRNVFGSRSSTGLCPANPDVRAYLVALLTDLTRNHPIQTVELESFGFEGFPHFHYHEKLGIPFGATDRFLLGLCFCDSCRRRAKESGADATAAARVVQRTVERTFESGVTTRQPLDEFVARARPLHAYLAAREETMRSLMAELRAACRSRLVFMHFMDRWTGAYRLENIASYFDSIMLLCYGAPKQTEEAIRNNQSPATPLHTGFHAYPPVTPDAGTLAEQVRTARRHGVHDMNFYHYGIMPRPNLRWIKSALR